MTSRKLQSFETYEKVIISARLKNLDYVDNKKIAGGLQLMNPLIYEQTTDLINH